MEADAGLRGETDKQAVRPVPPGEGCLWVRLSTGLYLISEASLRVDITIAQGRLVLVCTHDIVPIQNAK